MLEMFTLLRGLAGVVPKDYFKEATRNRIRSVCAKLWQASFELNTRIEVSVLEWSEFGSGFHQMYQVLKTLGHLNHHIR